MLAFVDIASSLRRLASLPQLRECADVDRPRPTQRLAWCVQEVGSHVCRVRVNCPSEGLCLFLYLLAKLISHCPRCLAFLCLNKVLGGGDNTPILPYNR